MNKNCIFCKNPLDETNRTNEHIIPKCMGGRLQSRDLNCRDCNNKFGTEFDEALIKRFCMIMYPLSLYNEQINLKNWEVEFIGIKFLITEEGLKLKDPRPIYDEYGEIKGMVFPSEEAMRKHYRRERKKDPTIDIQATIDHSEKRIKNIYGPFKFTIEQVGEKDYRCCGYYSYI